MRPLFELTPPTNPELNLSVVIATFLRHCKTGRGLSANTQRAYASDLRRLAFFVGADVLPGNICKDTIRRYVAWLLESEELHVSSVRRHLAAARVLFAWLETDSVIAATPFHRLGVSLRLPKSLPRALGADEIRSLLKQGSKETRLAGRNAGYDALLLQFVVVALFASGVRVGELAGAELEDVSLRDSSIHIRGKGNRERRVYLPGLQATRILNRFILARRRVLTDTPRLVVASSGQPLTTAAIRNRLGALARRAGVQRRVTPHMLRHTAATQLLEAGVDIRFVQKLLGHASIATTQIYTHVTDRALRAKLTRANTLKRVGIG